MIKNLQISKNYAKALLANLASEKQEDQLYNELEMIDKIFEHNEKCKKIFDAPVGSKSVKIKLIESIVEEKNLSQTLKMFLSLLVTNNRTDLLKDVIQSLRDMLNEKRKIKYVEIFSAKNLSDKEKKYLIEQLEKNLKLIISAKFIQDKSLISGLRIKYDDKLIDLSVMGALTKINQQIKNISLGE